MDFMLNRPAFTKNPILTFMAKYDRRRRRPVAYRLIGHPHLTSRGSRVQMPFTYEGWQLATEQGLLSMLRHWPHANDIFVDSSLFSPQRTTLSRQILIERTVQVISEVETELNDLKNFSQNQGHWTSVIFGPGGDLNSAFSSIGRNGFTDTNTQ